MAGRVTDALQQVAAAAANRHQAQTDLEAALKRAAAQGHTLRAIGSAAGLSYSRVGQIVGPLGRKPGRPRRV